MDKQPDALDVDSLTLHFERDKGNLDDIPATVLSKAIEASQQIVFLLAHQAAGVPLASTGRFQREIETNYTLMCSPLQPGSVVVPMHYAPATNLFASQQEVTDLFADVSAAVIKNDERELTKRLPDAQLRRRVLNGIDALIPPANSGIRATLSGPRNLNFVLTDSTRRSARDLRRATTSAPQPSVNQMVITGQLIRIDFTQRKLTLQYPVTKRELDCVYSDEIEEGLIAQRRDWIQVTGNVVLDAEGNPERVTDVEEVRPLDLSPVELREFDDEESGITLRFREPLSLIPSLDETSQLILLDHDPLNIHLHAYTREELEDSLYGLVWVLWDDYTKVPEAKLSVAAREFKALLMGAIEEVSIAA